MNPGAGGETLKGHCVLVTRPLRQSGKLVQELLSRGALVEELPLIRIIAPDSWHEFDQAVSGLEEFSWIVFASANAVESTIERIKFLGALSSFAKPKLACIGPATAASLSDYGYSAVLVPKSAIAESLVEEFPRPRDTSEPGGDRVLWPRTNIGRTVIKDCLEKLGWRVDMVPCYQTVGMEDPLASAARLKELIQNDALSAITLTSSETVHQLHRILKIAFPETAHFSKQEELLARIKLAAIGPETAKTCLRLFGRIDVQAFEFTATGLATSLERSLFELQ